MIKQTLIKILPRPLVSTISRVIRYGASDLVDAVTGRRDPLIPPKSLIFIGGPLFKEIGDEQLRIFREVGGLTPDDAVLDVGCGIGRSARPLTAFLSPQGSYQGFDIDAGGIKWCVKNITPRFPRFHFQVADVYNKYYNPKGRSKGPEYVFPYADASFDFVFLTSVFTHMLPAEVDNYLGQIARVLKPGGRALISYFLWNAESAALQAKGGGNIGFPYTFGNYRVRDKDFPEDAICFDEDFIQSLNSKHGLSLAPPVRYGTWCGRENALSYQDFVLVKKP